MEDALEHDLTILHHKAQGEIPFGDVFPEEVEPCIKCRSGDKASVAQLSDGTRSQIVFGKDSQYEADRIRTGRDKDIREYSLRMSTGSAQDSGYGNRYLFSLTMIGRDHGTSVRGNLLKLLFVTAWAHTSVQVNVYNSLNKEK